MLTPSPPTGAMPVAIGSAERIHLPGRPRRPPSPGSRTFAPAVPLRNAERRRHKRRAALASSKTTAHNGMWCPVLAAIHWSCYGTPGEQQHLPDWSSPQQQGTALRRLVQHPDKGQREMRRKRIMRRKRMTVSEPASALRTAPPRPIAVMDALCLPDAKGEGRARFELRLETALSA